MSNISQWWRVQKTQGEGQEITFKIFCRNQYHKLNNLQIQMSNN